MLLFNFKIYETCNQKRQLLGLCAPEPCELFAANTIRLSYKNVRLVAWFFLSLWIKHLRRSRTLITYHSSYDTYVLQGICHCVNLFEFNKNTSIMETSFYIRFNSPSTSPYTSQFCLIILFELNALTKINVKIFIFYALLAWNLPPSHMTHHNILPDPPFLLKYV